jgi:hypothetical protein
MYIDTQAQKETIRGGPSVLFPEQQNRTNTHNPIATHPSLATAVMIRVTLACARQELLSNKQGLQESTGTISGQHKAEPPARLRSAYMRSMISCALWNNGSKRARALSSISMLSESKEITLGSI